MSEWKPKLGDNVILNDKGLVALYGDATRVDMKRVCKVIESSEHSYTYPDKTYMIQVNEESLKDTPLDHTWFDYLPQRAFW